MQEIELDELQWRSPEWIQAFGLSSDNVLDYFALSPFYDRSSNNQVLKMQSNFNEQLQSRGSDLIKELQNMKGLEFTIAMTNDYDLWIIRKQNRRGPLDVDVLATYFVIGENIYQAPSCYNVIASRLLATSLCLGRGLQAAQQLATQSASDYAGTDINKDYSGGSTSTEHNKVTELRIALDITLSMGP